MHKKFTTPDGQEYYIPLYPNKNPQALFIGNLSSNIVHSKKCIHGQKILDKYQMDINSLVFAERAGFRKCGVCKPYQIKEVSR